MVHVPALPKIAVVLEDMLICLRRCGIGVILSIGSCVRGWESIMIQRCFRCRRSIRRWVCLSLSLDERCWYLLKSERNKPDLTTLELLVSEVLPALNR